MFRGSLSTNVPGMPGQGRAVADRSGGARRAGASALISVNIFGIFSRSPGEAEKIAARELSSPGLVVRRCRVWVLMLLEMIIARWHWFHNKTGVWRRGAFCVIFWFWALFPSLEGLRGCEEGLR